MTITPGLVSRGLLHVQQDVVPAQLFSHFLREGECDKSAGCRSAIIAEDVVRGWEVGRLAKEGKGESEKVRREAVGKW